MGGSKNVLVIGSGGREHAIVWKLAESEHVGTIFCAPGSYGIGSTVDKAQNVPLDIKNQQKVVEWCQNQQIDLVVVGPEDPLANGIADVLNAAKIPVFGPSRDAARIESDKSWSKAFMDRHGIPTARWRSFTDAEDAKLFIEKADFKALVVKASGLAAGKGVVVADSISDACAAVDSILTARKYGTAGNTIVIEELLEGEEISVLAFCDGNIIRAMLPAQDHKRLGDNDTGPNTGGMGAYCPCDVLDRQQLEQLEIEVLQRAVDGFKADNIPYVGVLYAGLMLTKDGPKVLEFNCRFGDPETEVVLPLLASDLYEITAACCRGDLHTIADIRWRENLCAVGVVMASASYPESSSRGQLITGVERVQARSDEMLFHCGTSFTDGKLVTNGGRVLITVAVAPQLHVAAARATRAAGGVVMFDGAQRRNDIAHKGIARSILKSGNMSYKTSGVDITAGNDLVSLIKPHAKSTNRPGMLGSLGGFGGLFDCKLAGYTDPILVSGTDGVGTKLKIAQEMNKHDTIGIDLVAMCVNDVLAYGAEPLFFLDYFACGQLDVGVAEQVVAGVATGCKQSNCALIGGETAEMPSVYPPGEYDLAGFTVGAVERDSKLTKLTSAQAGDAVIGLPSSGLHSNGFSLVRKVMQISGAKYQDVAVFSKSGKTYGDEFLRPTKIYVEPVLRAFRGVPIIGFAHITGGGLLENIPRTLSADVAVELDATKWDVNPIFGWLACTGGINEIELLRTFNCGIGCVLLVEEEHKEKLLQLLENDGAIQIGNVVERFSRDSPQVIINNFTKKMDELMRPFIPTLQRHLSFKKRVAVLISGTGSNMQALIEATRDEAQHINAEIVLVISNKATAEGLNKAKIANITAKVIDHRSYDTRSLFDDEIHKCLVAYNIDLVCLAGFMRILSDSFTSKWRGKLINIHPALLPLFKGMNGAKQALEAGVRVTGCTVHFVEAGVDDGAIIVQETVPVEPNDTLNTLQGRIHKAEHQAYPKALRLLANDIIKLGDDNKIKWQK